MVSKHGIGKKRNKNAHILKKSCIQDWEAVKSPFLFLLCVEFALLVKTHSMLNNSKCGRIVSMDRYAHLSVSSNLPYKFRRRMIHSHNPPPPPFCNHTISFFIELQGAFIGYVVQIILAVPMELLCLDCRLSSIFIFLHAIPNFLKVALMIWIVRQILFRGITLLWLCCC